MSRIRERVTYANVVSSLALFIALGGTSYALTLPRNSVGSKQIRTRAVGSSEVRQGAVRSSEVRDRSLGIQDLSLGARRLLQSPGPAGPPGPAGTPAISYRIAVNSGGGVQRGSPALINSTQIGRYVIGFDRSVLDCVSTATIARVPGGGVVDPPPTSRITVAREGGSVLVRTYDAAGTPTRLPFHLIVAC